MQKKVMKKKTTKKTMKKTEPLTTTRSYKPAGGAMPDPREAVAAETAAMMSQGVPVGTFGAPPSVPAFGSTPSASFGGGTAPRTGFGGGDQGGFGAPNPGGFGGGRPGGFGEGQNRTKSNFDFVTVLFSGKEEGKSYSATIKNDARGQAVATLLMSIRPGDAIGVSKTKAPDKYGRVSLNLWIRRAKGGNQGGGVPF